MDTPRWNRDTNLLALATSLDHMLASGGRLNRTTRSSAAASRRRLQTRVVMEAQELGRPIKATTAKEVFQEA